ncbi:MAG: TMEM14 family protein [Planctomycetaceae bacterium]|nr:TMEM14 family protein [Planctomycetaceae bacterium]MBV8269092.1 TMEM14 family protein [Planctomycetaceae bacterium]MBV8318467.1 TMEM14 family protein [Planctomycetaceae bacterium]MBV8382218.1 TMEM14 family protein [Planctomycetaceae bacterium]MBV8609618.1 TMEM14 family protein [Singulisphaera sp.]
MLDPIVGHVTLGIYAVLLAVGGIMGFVKAQSRASLIAGLVSAATALVALVLARLRYALGFPLGMALAIVLFLFFGYRFALRGRKFMPTGLLTVLSLVVLAIMILVVMDQNT